MGQIHLQKNAAGKSKTFLTGVPKEPKERLGYDVDRLYGASTLEYFVRVLESVLPYWRHWEVSSTVEAEVMLGLIRDAINTHDSKTEIRLPALPGDFTEAEKWAIDIRKLLKESECGRPKPPSKQAESNRSKPPSATARALAVLTEHPDWTDEEIAKKAEVHRRTLYKLPIYRKARKLLKEAGRKERQSTQGYKNMETGDMEAWEEE